MKINDLIGKKFNKLEVLEKTNPLHENEHTSYYICKCDCGTIKKIRGSALTTNNTKSCGCLGKNRHPQETSAKHVWKNYKNLDFNVFIFYSQLPCHYCGILPLKKTNQFVRWPHLNSYKNGWFIYNGIDRIDSKSDYNIKNIVPCCMYCNSAKNIQTYTDFLKWLNRLYLFNKQCLLNNISNFDKNFDKTLMRPAKKVWYRTYSDMPFDRFLILSQSNCYYCNTKPFNYAYNDRIKTAKFIYNGIDRINSNLGHVEGNIVPCCKWCNRAKLNRSSEDFYKWIDDIYINTKEKQLEIIPVSEFCDKYMQCIKNEVIFPL